MSPPFSKFVRNSNNPLGIDEEFFSKDSTYETKIKVLEYKHSLDGLIEELQSEVKSTNDIGLVIAWDMGTKWQQMFDVTCLFDDDTSHHRQTHGTTHSFTYSVSGAHAFESIILHDLVRYLSDPVAEVARQNEILGDAD